MRKFEIAAVDLGLAQSDGGKDFEDHDADGFAGDHEASEEGGDNVKGEHDVYCGDDHASWNL